MSETVKITVTLNRFPEITKALHVALAEIVAETVKEIADTYANTAAIDTGFMRSSAYTRTFSESTYGQGLVDVPGRLLHEEVDKPTDDQEAYAAVAADYASYLEYGTRFINAQPAFLPATDAARQSFSAKLGDLERRVGG